MFTIQGISQLEDQLVKNAADQYGEVYHLALSYLEFSWEFIEKFMPQAEAFLLMMGQVRSSNYLAFLSILRHHLLQSKLNMRVSLESSVLACYSLENFEIDKVMRSKESSLKDLRKAEEKFKKNSIKWINEKYSSHSEIIKEYKDKINETYAHASFTTSTFNGYSDENVYSGSFFDRSIDDKEGHYDVVVNLMHYSMTIKQELDFYYDVIKNNPFITLCDNFDKKNQTLYQKWMKLSEYI